MPDDLFRNLVATNVDNYYSENQDRSYESFGYHNKKSVGLFNFHGSYQPILKRINMMNYLVNQ